MSGYEVEIAQLRQAASAAQSCGDQLGEVDAAATMTGVPGALPGSRSGSPIKKLAGAWRGQVTHLSRRFVSHATSLTQSADRDAANETAAAEVFTPVSVDDTRGEP